VVTSQYIVNVVDTTRSQSNLTEVSRPHSSIGILSLINREISGVDSIMDHSISIFPFLVVVLLEMMMSRVNAEHTHHVG
jgi:hypothetical protein